MIPLPKGLCGKHAFDDPLGVGCVMIRDHRGSCKLDALPEPDMSMVVLARKIIMKPEGVIAHADVMPIVHAWLRQAYPYYDPQP